MSHYAGFCIHRREDAFGVIEVVDHRSLRKLHFGTPVEQSSFYLNAPLRLVFEYQQKIIDLVEAFANGRSDLRILLLGLGGGRMATHLNLLYPDWQITAVELRQAVIDIAYRYFQLPEVAEIETLQEDALTFVAENPYPFDIVIIDLFDSEGIPDAFSSTDFQPPLQRQLKTPGLLVFNLWNRPQSDPQQKPQPCPASGQILNHWQNVVARSTKLRLNRYNIASSENLILAIEQN